ncbi:hypothetical protein F4803DRAFT_546765 [Xylaria telfairii]|nr:hypothetical protein F4803DRAFT_546765 [Xylaria telfairii]
MPKPNETIAIVITLLVLFAFIGFYLLTMRLRDPSADNYDDDQEEDDDDGDNDGDDTDSVDLDDFAAQPEIPRPPPPAVHAFRGEPGLEGRGLAAPIGGEGGLSG